MTPSAHLVLNQSGKKLGWPQAPSAPRWFAWVPQTAIAWALGYGVVRLWWALHGYPHFGRLGFDLIFIAGWPVIALFATAAGLALALRFVPWTRALLLAAWAVCAVHLIACPLLLLDIVSAILPGIGLPFSAAGFFSRTGCLIQGLLLGSTAIAYRRRWRSECLFCGRSTLNSTLTSIRPSCPAKPPRWAWWAAYSAAAGCLLRLVAQYTLASGDIARNLAETRLVVEALIFEAAFLLAGIVLPLALVHSWGRTLPQWLPVLSGRRVPRWLLLGPAFAISPLMTVYFSITLLKIATDALRGTSAQTLAPFSPAFFWIAVPAYLVWGLGLGIASISYYRITRPKCSACGL